MVMNASLKRIINHVVVVLFLSVLLCMMPSANAEPLMEDIAFTADCDGTEQRYVLWWPDTLVEKEGFDLLIALHGHGSDRWQQVTLKRDECKSKRDAATRHKMLMCAPDYRAKTSWMGPKAEADMVQIITELKAKYKIRKVIFAGGSMGGSSVLTFTPLHPELIDGVVSMNGTANHLEYENFQEAIRESYGGTKAEIPEEYKKRSGEYFPEKFTMPIAFATGGKDTSVPPDSVLRISAILKKINPNVLHIHQPEGGHSTNYEDATKVLEFVINKVCKPEADQ